MKGHDDLDSKYNGKTCSCPFLISSITISTLISCFESPIHPMKQSFCSHFSHASAAPAWSLQCLQMNSTNCSSPWKKKSNKCWYLVAKSLFIYIYIYIYGLGHGRIKYNWCGGIYKYVIFHFLKRYYQKLILKLCNNLWSLRIYYNSHKRLCRWSTEDKIND
jgi:hypothetical protein